MNKEMVVTYKKKELILSIFVFLLSLLFPIYFSHQNLEIYEFIDKGLEFNDKEYIIVAMFKLVFLNTVRSFPTYISMLILFDSIKINFREKEKIIIKIIIISLLIPITYIFIDYIYKISMPLGKTSIFGILWFFYYAKLDFKNINFFQKITVFLFFIVGLQWLDISPYFNILRIGEITLYLNQAIEFMGAELITIVLCMSFFLFFSVISILFLYFFKLQEEIIMRQKSEFENRYLKEVQQLVHDLKTPIFSIETLLEVLLLQEESEYKIRYFNKIEESLEKVNIMISEILNSKLKKPFSIEDMMNFVFSFLSVSNNKINYKNYSKEKDEIYGNRIIISRAIINLITNSWEANSTKVDIVVKKYGKFILISIEDDGDGIGENSIQNLMTEGISTKSSSGKGLAFVSKVIEDYNGKFYMLKQKKGVKNYIIFKGVGANEK